MEIRELKSFIQIARAGSFSRAAAQLNIAQPALSRQMKKLEDELDSELFVRNARGVELTEAGSVLLSHAESVMIKLAETSTIMRTRQEKFTGHVVLGLPPHCGCLIAADIVRIFKSRWPHATLVVREGISCVVEEWLLDRRLDLAVIHNPMPLEGIDIEPVLHERMVLVRRPAEDGAPEIPEVRIRNLGEHRLILPTLPHCNRRLVERAAARHGGRINLVAEVDSVSFTKAMVRAGIGETIQPLAGVAAEVAAGTLEAIPIDRPPLMSMLAIARPRETRSVWLTMETSRLLHALIRGYVDSGAWPMARIVSADPVAEVLD